MFGTQFFYTKSMKSVSFWSNRCPIYQEKILFLTFSILWLLFFCHFSYIRVQYDFNIRWCSCRLAVTRWVPLVEQELPILFS